MVQLLTKTYACIEFDVRPPVRCIAHVNSRLRTNSSANFHLSAIVFQIPMLWGSVAKDVAATENASLHPVSAFDHVDSRESSVGESL